MISSRENEYIIKCQAMFFYFYLINNVLYIERSENGRKGKRKKLIDDIKEFSVALDEANTINMVCLDTSDRLFHLYHKDGKWRKRLIVDLGMNSVKLRDLRLFMDKDNLNLICLRSHIPRRNIWRIVHYTFYNRTWSGCDIGEVNISKYLSPYKIDVDTNHNLHIIYRPLKGNKNELYYRLFNSKHRKWSLAAKLGSHPSSIINMNILCDTQNVVHVIWSCLEGKNIIVNYFRKIISFSLATGWKKSKTFPKAISNFTNPVLLQDNNDIKLIWRQNDHMYLTETSVGKDMWCNIRALNNILDSPSKPLIYIGDIYKSLTPVKVPFSYGYFDEEIFILGLDTVEETDGLSNILFENNSKKLKKALIEKEKNEKSKNDIEQNLIKYIEDIRPQIIDKEIVSDILNVRDNTPLDNEPELDESEDTYKDEMLLKLFDIYDEINDLKEHELEFLEQLAKLKDEQSEIREKVDKIFNICWRTK